MVLKKKYMNMPRIKIRFFANFREFTKTNELEIEGGSVKEILEIICHKFNGIGDMLFKDDSLHPYVHVFLNGEDLRGKADLEKPLSPGDEIAIFPPVSGGSCSRKG